MKKSHLWKGVPFVGALLLTAAISVAQQPAQQPQAQAQAPALELYHIHMSKAAPGKLPQLTEAYQTAPAPDASEPQVTPIILRHREGGEWDLITITPLGKQVTLTVVNSDLTAPRETEIAVAGASISSCQARVLSATDVHAHNSFENPSVLAPRDETVSVGAGGALVFRFAPASVTRLQLALV